MDPAELMAATTGVVALALPTLAIGRSISRQMAQLELRLPSPRLSGTIVLCAALASLGRFPTSAAVPPPITRDAGAAAAASESPVPASSASGYVVKPGDSLWAIACRWLSTSDTRPTDAAVDGMWREIYATNRALIGDDPDLIYPGTRLTIPERSA